MRKVVEYKVVDFSLSNFTVTGKLIDDQWEPWGSPFAITVTKAAPRDGFPEKQQVIAQAFVRYSDD